MIKHKEALDILEDLKMISELWVSFKDFLMKSFTNEDITQEMEQVFLDIKSRTSKYLRVLSQKIESREFKYEPEKMTTLLRQAISIVHLRGLPVADRRNLLTLWHETYIYLTQARGAFEFIAEGYQPSKKERRDTSIAAMKKGAADAQKRGKKSGAKKNLLVVVILFIIAGAAFFILKRR